jgi:iron(III) transport system ATP-binding protein
MSELVVKGLRKSFGSHRVLDGLDLSAQAGSFTAILGPSGSGKTTLLRLLAGFEAPDGGTVQIGQQIVDGQGRHVHPEQRRIGYVPQEGGLFPHLSVQANVAFGLPRAKRRDGAAQLLELVGLSDLAKRYPHQLSGGQQQRVALARALAIKPEIVLLDEPFASLDAHLRVSVRDQVRGVLREAGATALLVTHDQDEALSLADQVAVLRGGRIVQCAPPQELYARPVDSEVARFVGEANLVAGTMDGEFVNTPLGRLAAQWRQEPQSTPCPVNVLIRPEQIELSSNGGGAAHAHVLRSGYHGHATVLHLQLAGAGAGGVVSPLVARAPGSVHVDPGAGVTISVRGPVLVWARPAG